jgi:hypothetical protein
MDRWITEGDKTVLEESLKKDRHHQKTTPDFFYEPGSFCKVYETDKPILFLRATKALRLDIQFVDNTDFENNRKIMLEEFPIFVENCKKAGFTELIFETDSPLLKRFCIQKLKFDEVQTSTLRYFIG